MSFISIKQHLASDKWLVPNRREIGIGLQFFAVGLIVGNVLGIGYGHQTDEVFWIQLSVTGLFLVGSWMTRHKAGEVIWIQLVVIGLILLVTWTMFRHMRGH
jgi:uncharacterized membrane-anchored protein YitT (DUF2179 family)